MRILKEGYKLKNRYGDRRIVKKFLLRPREFQGDWRWLEYAYIEELIEHKRRTWRQSGPAWIEVRFSDLTEYLMYYNILTGESIKTSVGVSAPEDYCSYINKTEEDVA